MRAGVSHQSEDPAITTPISATTIAPVRRTRPPVRTAPLVVRSAPHSGQVPLLGSTPRRSCLQRRQTGCHPTGVPRTARTTSMPATNASTPPV